MCIMQNWWFWNQRRFFVRFDGRRTERCGRVCSNSLTYLLTIEFEWKTRANIINWHHAYIHRYYQISLEILFQSHVNLSFAYGWLWPDQCKSQNTFKIVAFCLSGMMSGTCQLNGKYYPTESFISKYSNYFSIMTS